MRGCGTPLVVNPPLATKEDDRQHVEHWSNKIGAGNHCKQGNGPNANAATHLRRLIAPRHASTHTKSARKTHKVRCVGWPFVFII